MPEQSSNTLLAWLPAALAFISSGWWGIRKGFNFNQRLARVEEAIAEGEKDRAAFMAEYKKDRKQYQNDSTKIAVVEERTNLILQELRRR